jgi:hypothetical protein
MSFKIFKKPVGTHSTHTAADSPTRVEESSLTSSFSVTGGDTSAPQSKTPKTPLQNREITVVWVLTILGDMIGAGCRAIVEFFSNPNVFLRNIFNLTKLRQSESASRPASESGSKFARKPVSKKINEQANKLFGTTPKKSDPPPPLQNLFGDGKNYELRLYKTFGDGSCMLHACNEVMPYQEAMKLVTEQRQKIADMKKARLETSVEPTDLEKEALQKIENHRKPLDFTAPRTWGKARRGELQYKTRDVNDIAEVVKKPILMLFEKGLDKKKKTEGGPEIAIGLPDDSPYSELLTWLTASSYDPGHAKAILQLMGVTGGPKLANFTVICGLGGHMRRAELVEQETSQADGIEAPKTTAGGEQSGTSLEVTEMTISGFKFIKDGNKWMPPEMRGATLTSSDGGFAMVDSDKPKELPASPD